ncbi:MAG: alpha-hydroxyketone-type quorum-sensing autoinducer synthase [Duganella sp.]
MSHASAVQAPRTRLPYTHPPAELCMPAYVRRRMDEHYLTRIAGLLGGEHPHAWQAAPPGAVFLAGNDYLCLAGEPALVRAQVAALHGREDEQLMSAVYLQEGSRQHQLEHKFARFLGAGDAILTQSGWAANVGLVQTLAEPGIPVYLDMQAHASLWEGVQSAGALAVSFRHNDIEHLQRQLARHGRGVIAVDALYSTNGSMAPLEALAEIAGRTGCVLIVDESHSLGTHGPRGAGLVAAHGLQDQVHFRTASLAKAFAGRAGIITCSSKFKGYFLSASRPAIFSSCLLGHELAWFDAAIDFVAAADQRRVTLHVTALALREALGALGYNVSDGSEQIIALEAGSEPKTLALRKLLERHGVVGAMFCAPATPKNRALVRLTLNAGLERAQLLRIVEACAAIRDAADVGNWSSTRRLQRLALA